MTIMPGGGITKDNLADLEKVLEFNEVHGTRIV
jgi:copper homeostasis protein